MVYGMETIRKDRIGGGWLTRGLPYEEAAPLVMSMLCMISIQASFFNHGRWTDWNWVTSLILTLGATMRGFQAGIPVHDSRYG